MPVTVQEITWILRAQAGDNEALNELLKVLQEPLYRYLRSLVGEATLAEDALQEVFILIYRKLRWLREPEWFRAWAYRIATREAFKILRRERRWSEQVRDEVLLDAVPAPPVWEEFAPEMVAAIGQFIEQLPPASRAVVVLHYLHELTLEEVAGVLGISVGTVKSRLAYGLRSLRRQFQQNPDSRV